MDIINIVHRLDHSVSYSILNEMHTENAYIVHERQKNNDVILPLVSQKETFTIYVADNIYRNEETLSGKWICLNQYVDQRFMFYLLIYSSERKRFDSKAMSKYRSSNFRNWLNAAF